LTLKAFYLTSRIRQIIGVFLRTILSAFLAVLLLLPISATGEIQNITAVGDYVLSDNDTFIEGKKLALQNAKRMVLDNKLTPGEL
jgi:hypothetical protein